MAGLFGLSINSKKYKKNFLDTLFLGMFYHQHLGKRGGFVYFENGEPEKQEFKGAVGSNYIGNFGKTDSCAGIAYYGNENEPFFFDSILGNIAICFCGNILNIDELRMEIKKDGGILQREFDIEVVAEFIVRCGLKKGNTQGQKIINGIKTLNEKLKGAYSLLILTEEVIFAVYGPDGRWPLIIGKDEKDGSAIVVASETGGFSNLGIKIFKELQPGEIISIKNGRLRRVTILPKKDGKDARFCDFLLDYTFFPTSMLRGISSATARKKLGACLARRDIEERFFPHLIIPVPDSGRFHAIGYFHEFWKQVKSGRLKVDKLPLFDEILLKYTSVRSFLEDEQHREKSAYYKILITLDYLDYLIDMLRASGDWELLRRNEKDGCIVIAVIDDSFVRGTQSESNLIPKIKAMLVNLEKKFTPLKLEIHLRSSYPEIRSHCCHGKTTRKKGEILAVKIPDIKDRARKLGVASLKYNSPTDFIGAIGVLQNQVCMDCAFPSKK